MVATSSIRSQREYAASIQQTRRRAPQPVEPAFVPSRDPAPPQSTVSGYKGRAFAQRPASATLLAAMLVRLPLLLLGPKPEPMLA